MKREHSDHHCPTCGSEVVIHSSDEGTSYMEPKHSDQEISSLREQLKEKEEEILYVELELKQKLRLLRSCEIALEKRDKQLQSQLKLIESLAGALEIEQEIRRNMDIINYLVEQNCELSVPNLKDLWNSLSGIVIKLDKALTEYNNHKNKQNGK